MIPMGTERDKGPVGITRERDGVREATEARGSTLERVEVEKLYVDGIQWRGFVRWGKRDRWGEGDD